MSLIDVLIAAFGVGGSARPAGADQGCGESGLFTMDNRPAPGDFDGDADVDLVDFGFFQACFAGPSRPPACGN